MNGPPKWIVVRKCETEPVEAYPFEEEAAARTFFEEARGHWSDTFLCEVKEGPKV